MENISKLFIEDLPDSPSVIIKPYQNNWISSEQ